MFDIILAFVALGILVSVHETGHFLAARLCGVRVEKFSIGFGKPILKFTRKEIEYRLGWIPLGGYVKMKGEALDEEQTEETDSFRFTKWWKKIIIAFSGPLANLVLAIVIFIFTFALPGRAEDQYPVIGKSSPEFEFVFEPGDSIVSINEVPVKGWYHFISHLSSTKNNHVKLKRDGHLLDMTTPAIDLVDFTSKVMPLAPAVVGEVSPGMPAWRAGIMRGDSIISINSVPVNDWYEMREMILNSSLDSVLVTLKRNNAIQERSMPLEQNPLVEGQRMIGITQSMPVSYRQVHTPVQALEYGVKSTFGFIALNYAGLYKIITNPKALKSSVGGPVMIYSLSSQSAKRGAASWLMFVAAISLVLMIMNLLPIPVLDGGHIIFALIQGVIGKPIPIKVQLVLQNIGVVLLLMLMVYAFYNDFTKVITRAVSNMSNP